MSVVHAHLDEVPVRRQAHALFEQARQMVGTAAGCPGDVAQTDILGIVGLDVTHRALDRLGYAPGPPHLEFVLGARAARPAVPPPAIVTQQMDGQDVGERLEVHGALWTGSHSLVRQSPQQSRDVEVVVGFGGQQLEVARRRAVDAAGHAIQELRVQGQHRIAERRAPAPADRQPGGIDRHRAEVQLPPDRFAAALQFDVAVPQADDYQMLLCAGGQRLGPRRGVMPRQLQSR